MSNSSIRTSKTRPSRREFLGAAGAGGALALLGFPGCSSPPAPDAGPLELVTRSETPFNAEPELDRLSASWVTPSRHFFVRMHGAMPSIDVSRWSLSVEGMVDRPMTIPLERLERDFGTATVPATLECAGNRRSELSQVKPVAGVQWNAGAIGNAEWRGPRLGDILLKAGVKNGARFAWFEGIDEPPVAGKPVHFGAAIPLEKAVGAETLIALEMNGRPLTREHGAPARALVPGYVGARSVKWLGRVILSDRWTDNPWSARDYKLFPPDVTAQTVKWEERDPVLQYALSSVICTPRPGAEIPAGRLKVRGYALSPEPLERVEVSADGGTTWVKASLEGRETQWTWRLWQAELELGKGPRVLAVRATDAKGATQPEKGPWNFKGYLYTGWHRVSVNVL